MGRLYGIADIHGRLDLLNKLLDTLYTVHNLDLSVDKIIFTGDMVDRGPDSYGVLTRIKALEEAHPGHVIVLAGNHEWINIMRFARGSSEDVDMFERNGGLDTLRSYQLAGFSGITQDHLVWMSKLPLKHEEPGFFFSHAPVPRESYRNLLNKGQDFTPDELTWTYNRDEWGVARDHGNGIIGFCGHVHALSKGLLEPRFYDHYIYGDSGCGCSDKAPLCAIEVRTREVIYAWP